MLAQVGLKRHPGHAGAPADRGREAAGRDRQGAGAARAAADHGRAYRDLTPGETEALFGLMDRLKADGVTIVYISHKLDEVERTTDEVIVMRDGRFVARAPTAT